MYKSQDIAYYGTQEKLGSVLGVSQEAVSQWGEIIPEKQAARLFIITKGELPYDPLVYDNKNNSASLTAA